MDSTEANNDTVFSSSWERAGPAYENQTAVAKKADLWKLVTANTETYGYYGALE